MMIKQKSLRAIIGASLIVVSFLSLLALGTWQTQRLEWKNALVEAINTGINMAPVPLGDSDEHAEYNHVQISGVFNYDQEFYLHAIDKNGYAGFHIYVPLMRQGERTIIVNRGFVPPALVEPETRVAGQVLGVVSLTGVLRKTAIKKYFIPENEIENNRWFYADLGAMAKAAGLSEADVYPMFVEADFGQNKNNIPRGGVTRVKITNNHLGYAITWFGLALALLVVVFIYNRNKTLTLNEDN